MRPIEGVWSDESSLMVSGVVMVEDIARWWRLRRVAGLVFAP